MKQTEIGLIPDDWEVKTLGEVVTFLDSKRIPITESERKKGMYLEVKDMKKSYGEGGSYIQVLKGVTTGVEQGQMCVIQGTSGSGKSTLLNVISGMDTYEEGEMFVENEPTSLGGKSFGFFLKSCQITFSFFHLNILLQIQRLIL
mgnify:CR=1 FL=1